MKRIFPTLLVLWLSVFAYGQSNPKVKEMEVQRNLIEQQISESKRLLSTTQKNVEGQLAQLSALSAQIKKQKAYIERIDADVKALDRELTNIEEQLKTLQIELERRRQHYAYALQKMVHKNTFENRLMFIFLAESFNQMIRRMRYLREYSTFQQKQGELLLSQQKELDQKRNELEQTREAKKGLLAKRLEEKKELDHQEAEQRKIVNNLKKQQKDIRSQIAKQQREREKLNQQIEKIIEAEIAAQREEQRKKISPTKAELFVFRASVATRITARVHCVGKFVCTTERTN
jgi:peptidoglycan hydrolase CwlO-like protein